MRYTRVFTGVLVTSCLAASAANGGLITSQDIVPLTNNLLGSGNGTLDLILLTESAGGAHNSAGAFNGDNANTDMPTGANGAIANGSYITSIGEIRAFYELNFPNIPISEIVLFVDVNQITNGLTLSLDDLVIVTDYDQTFGDSRDNPALNDITSAKQNATKAGFSGGVVRAELDSPKPLPLVEQGAGWGDYAILTGVDPYDAAFADDTRIIFHWESSGHDDGGETIFLSGRYQLPEPGSLGLLLMGITLVGRRAFGKR